MLLARDQVLVCIFSPFAFFLPSCAMSAQIDLVVEVPSQPGDEGAAASQPGNTGAAASHTPAAASKPVPKKPRSASETVQRPRSLCQIRFPVEAMRMPQGREGRPRRQGKVPASRTSHCMKRFSFMPRARDWLTWCPLKWRSFERTHLRGAPSNGRHWFTPRMGFAASGMSLA